MEFSQSHNKLLNQAWLTLPNALNDGSLIMFHGDMLRIHTYIFFQKMSFWKPGTVAPGSDFDRNNESLCVYLQNQHLPVKDQRALLPIHKHKNTLLYLIETHQVVVVVGHTGSGKTTQLPQFLSESGWTQGKMIACTQPRRIAATSVANRVSEEVNSPLGQKVGYSVRFDEVFHLLN
jgi:ATP-dependent RNA helicase DDX35